MASNGNGEIMVFAGTAGQALKSEICSLLRIDEAPCLLQRFGDGEIELQLKKNVRGTDVFIINPTSPSADNMLEMVLLAKAARGASARRVTIIPTYLGYNRQERKDRSRVAISAKVFIDMLKVSGADRALLFDLHSEATAAHFEPMVTDHLYGSYVGVPHMKKLLTKKFVVASPDAGGTARARKYAEYLGSEDLVIFDKKRKKPGVVAENSIRLIGDVRGKDVVLVDDIIDSGGTMINDAGLAKKKGAKRIFAFATHGIFSKGLGVFPPGLIEEIAITNSIPQDLVRLRSNNVRVTVLSVAPLFADAIRRLNEEKSLSELILQS